MTACRAWRHDVCTEPDRCDCWCHRENDSQRIVAEEYAATDPKPGLFWLDLADDLRDPAFRRAYEAGWREALKARDTAYDDDRCSCTECLIEHLAACPSCSGPVRETVGMVCQTCGTDYAKRQGER